MVCIRQNHTYNLEHTMFVIAKQELPQQHLINAVLHLEVAMRPKPFNQVPFPSVTESQSVNLCIVPLLRTWKCNLIVFIYFFCIYFLPRHLPRLPQRKLRPRCIAVTTCTLIGKLRNCNFYILLIYIYPQYGPTSPLLRSELSAAELSGIPLKYKSQSDWLKYL